MRKNIVLRDINSIKMWSVHQRIFKHTKNPDFVNQAYLKYGIPDPIVANINGTLKLIANEDALQLAIENGVDELEVVELKMSEQEILMALIALSFHRHKEYRSMAELIAVLNEQIAIHGSKFLFDLTKTHDKNKQLCIVTGLSKHAVKCYKKILLPGNSEYLNRLGVEYSITEAYNEICTAERKAERDEDDADDNGSGSGSGSGNDTSSTNSSSTNIAPSEPTATPVVPDESFEDEPIESIGTQPLPNAKPSAPVIDPTGDGIETDAQAFTAYLKAFKKKAETSTTSTAIDLSKCNVIVAIPSNSFLKFPAGKLLVDVNGQPLNSTEQLVQDCDGSWKIKDTDEAKLTLIIEDDFFRDF